MDDLGELKWRDVRDVWELEASSFTPWLKENLPILADALGLELDLVEREAPVGNFSCDIVAKDLNSDRWVIIENQLEPTDHTHLGQLLTYAANRKAGVVVWVSTEFRDEHREAIEWLNDSTAEGIDFFGLQLELLQIDDSRPALNLDIAVKPNYWSKRISRTSDPTPRQRDYNEFFSELLVDLKEKAPGITSAQRVSYESWFCFGAGRSGFTYNFAFSRDNRFRVELLIDRGDVELNEQSFDALREEAEEIQQEVGEELEWDRTEGKRVCRVAVYWTRPVQITDPPEKLAELRSWAIATVIGLRGALTPRIVRLP